MGVSQPREPTQVVGRYAVYGEIASGGMATIHIGRLLGPVGFSRTVAIKRLHAQYAKDPEFVAMFLDEARLAARIQNPNVVQTMDVVSEGDTLFLVMEYIQGEAFSKLWRLTTQDGSQVPLPIVSAVVGGMLHGLHAVHEATDEHGAPLGIVHRDVSPQNVIVGVDGTPRVLDFGVAKAAGRLQSTRDGQLKGKLAYMGPEQLTGAPVARSSDVYSAAVVLWEALTGTRLYDGDNDARVFASVLAGNPPPPSHLVPDLPEQLDAVVMRGLEREPQKRFKTAREMALALEAVIRSASATDVGAWVERLAESSLAKRAAQVQELESNSAIKVPPVQPHRAANSNALETPHTIPQAFEPIRLPMGSVTEAFEVDEDDAPTAYHPSVKMVNGELVYGAAVEGADVEPVPTPATDLGGTLPLATAPYGRPVTGPVLVPDPAPSSSGSWARQYDSAPQSQAALSQSQPWVAQSAQQQYAGSNASISGSISRQMIAPAYDASQSIAYNPSASVQIVTVSTTSTAMKFLIAIATIALVFALFAVFMELRRNLSHGQDHAAASPSPVHSSAQSAPTTTNPFDNTDMNTPPPIMTGAPISQPFLPPGALTAAPNSNATSIASVASSSTAAAPATTAKKQKTAPPPPQVNKPQRIAPRQLPPGCVTPFTLDANGIKVPKPECM